MRSFFNLLLALPAALAAPIVHEVRDAAEVIPGSFVVRMQDNAVMSEVLSAVTTALGKSPSSTFQIGSFKGFSIDGVPDAVNLLSALPSITAIEPNAKFYTSVQQQSPPYGLARISHRNPGASTYDYDSSAGAGTFSYGIDTGILTTHPDFDGRAEFGKSFVPTEPGSGDGNGHGTHTAGTMGSTTYGVAKKTHLIAVKVLDSNGTGATSQVINGIAWAANDAKTKGRIGKAVGNLSLGSNIPSQMTDDAAAAAVTQGLFLAVAAGNSGLPAGLSSPAREPTVCTVGAIDSTDTRASFSNFGAVVDVFAPGVDVISTWNDGKTKTISGTSMAAPHVAGLGAYLLALEGPRQPGPLCDRIKALATSGKVKSPGLLSPNLIAYNGATG